MRPFLVIALVCLLLLQCGCAQHQDEIASAAPPQTAAPPEPDDDATLRKYSWSDSWLGNHPVLNLLVTGTEGTVGGIFLGTVGVAFIGLIGLCYNSPSSYWWSKH